MSPLDKRLGLTPKQLELRRNVLGGTDAPALLGLSRWKELWDVYAEKVGDVPITPSEMNGDMLWGLLLEPVIRDYYAETTGRKVSAPKRLIRNRERPWQGGHLDGRARDRGLEIKKVRYPTNWGEPGSEDIPADFKIQVWHYMAVTGLRLFDVAVLIGGWDYRVYTLHWRAGIEDLIAEEHDFWQQYVVPRQPPPFDGSDAASRWLRRRYPNHTDRELVALPHQYSVLNAYIGAKRRAALWDQQVQMYEQQIQEAMGDARRLRSPQLVVTWTKAKDGERVDYKNYVADLERYIREHIGGEDLDARLSFIRAMHTAPRPGSRRFMPRILTPALEEAHDD